MLSIFRRRSATPPSTSPPPSGGPAPTRGPRGPADLSQRAAPISARLRFAEGSEPIAQDTMRPRQASPIRPPTPTGPASGGATPEQARAAATLAILNEVEQWRQRAEGLAPQIRTVINYGTGHDTRSRSANDAAEQIRTAAADHAQQLAIHMLPATNVPQAIGQMSHLRQLSISATECDSLPDSIGDLSQLLKLELAANQALTRLPDRITDLGRLQTLVAHLTPLRTLPLQIGSLSRLTTLSLSGGTYEALPRSFTDLSRLKVLDISRSQPERQALAPPGTNPANLRKGLTKLPADFDKLRSLEQLTISDHARLADIPASLYNLPHLKELTLSKCPEMKALPATGLQPLRNLAKLDLTHNAGLTDLPTELGQLPRLEELNLKGNKGLVHLPDMAGLTQLRTLNLEGCTSLPALPAGLGGLGTLRELNLRHCHNLPNQEVEEVVAMLPPACQVTLPNGVQRTGGPRPVVQPRAERAARMPRFHGAHRVEEPRQVRAWKARLAPVSGDDPNGRFAQWMEAASHRRMTNDDIGRMNRIVDTAVASAAFRAKVFDFAAQHVMLERDDMGMTLVGVPPRTFTTVRDMHNLLVEHDLSDPSRVNAEQARQILAGAMREQYPHSRDPQLVGDPPPAVVVPGMHVRQPWPPLAAYVRTHDLQGQEILAKAGNAMEKLQADAGLLAGEEAGSTNRAQGSKGTAKPSATKTKINEGEYRKRSNALMQSRDIALHKRYVALAAQLLETPRAHPGAAPRR